MALLVGDGVAAVLALGVPLGDAAALGEPATATPVSAAVCP